MNSILKFIMPYLTDKLTVIFDKFKMSSPKMALVVFAAIAAIVKSADYLLTMPEITLVLGGYAELIKNGVYALGLIFTALTGASTPKPTLAAPAVKPTPIVVKEPEVGSIINQLPKTLAPTTNKKPWKNQSKPKA